MYKKALKAACANTSFDGIDPTAVNSVNAGLLAYYMFHPNAFLVDAWVPTNGPASIQGCLTDLQSVAYFAQMSGLAKASPTPGEIFLYMLIFCSVCVCVCVCVCARARASKLG